MAGQGILTGPQILREVESGAIRIDPFRPEHVNPVSYDLTLGPQAAVYKATVERPADFGCRPFHAGLGLAGVPGERLRPRRLKPGEGYEPGKNCLDSAQPNEVVSYGMDDRGLLLLPEIGYLLHTAERVRTDKYVPILDGKSSIGRLFCLVDHTAGFGDPGFDGQYTLEVSVVHPLVVYPGMRFCQMRFHTLAGQVRIYEGNYVGELAEGPVPSKSWKQFRKG